MPFSAEYINTLFIRMKSGEQEAFNIIFRRYYPPLCAFAKQYVGDNDSENIVQDIMLYLWENREELEIQDLNTYLFTATRNRCLTLINHGLIKQKVAYAIHKSMSEQMPVPDLYVVEELTKNLESALASLPPSYRESFILNRFQNKSYKEIAADLGISPKTVDYRIQQALKRLRIILKDYLPILTGIL